MTLRHIRRAGRSRLAAAVSAAAVCAAAAFGAAATPAQSASSAVVLMYHRFGEDSYPSTNIRLDQFEAHLREIADGGYTVLPLPEILTALKTGRSLPDRTIGLSVDDAYLSVYTEAWPRLRKANLPFTLFVSTDPVDQGYSGIMTWDQIRELSRDGVTIGNHTASHLHMPLATRAHNVEEIAKANQRFVDELGRKPRLFAYPYGEMSSVVRDVVVEAGFTAAFGQHSGVIYRGAPYYYLPRFAMNESYGDIGRFRLAANALPLEVDDVVPSNPMLGKANNPPNFGFTVSGAALERLNTLACYASGQGKARIERLGKARIEVKLQRAFSPGRARINCTMPASQGRWRWYGIQFYVPR
jgi:peptidoglycan/xylan/chitin deacetylase (PgdA/CDA1 family)